MAKYYVTVADSMSQGANAFSALQTQPDGGTLSSVKVPPGMTKIVQIGYSVIVDGAWTADTGNNFTLQLSGTGMKDGIQELNLGALGCQVTGTSVTGTVATRMATYREVTIALTPGEINLAGAFDGTDPGTPFLAVTLGLA